MSNDASIHSVPRGLDTPVPIFFWEPSVLIIAVVVLGLGIVLKQPIVGFGGCWALLQLAKRMKRGAKKGQGLHLAWRYGLEVDPLMKKYGFRPFHQEFMK